MRFALLSSLLVPALSVAQYSSPESVEYDAVNNRYLVSNTGDGTIKQRNQAGVVTPFASVSPAPYGLEIMNDVVYACSGGGIKAFDMNGAAIQTINAGGSFLNGITGDGTYLYATDFSAKKIFKYLPGGSVTTLVANTVFTPNGIVYDPVGDRLVVVGWGSNAPIRAVDKNTGAITPLVTTFLTNIDGITIDCLGNFLVASWSPDAISRFEPTFTQPGELVSTAALSNPADIDFDTVNNRICIPSSGSNAVTLHDVGCNTSIDDAPTALGLRAIPNPTSGLVRIEPALTRDEPYILLDARGLLVGGGTISRGAMLDIGKLTDGVYLIEFTRTSQRLRVVKE